MAGHQDRTPLAGNPDGREMRRIIMSAILLAAAVILQLTTINGLRLPGGGVPDLVLVVVAAVSLASGPAPGAIAGFAAGLCLDLAPPGSGVIGEYALAFVLVGWACGRLRGTLSRSAAAPILIVAAAAAAGEILVAGLGLALQSAQVSWAAIRQLLPAAMGYDAAISPFALYLVLLAGAWLTEFSRGRPAASASAAPRSAASRSGLGRMSPGRSMRASSFRGPPFRGQQFRGQPFRRQDSGPAPDGRPGGRGHRAASAARLRAGVAGSAAPGQLPRTLAVRPVRLRFDGRGRGTSAAWSDSRGQRGRLFDGRGTVRTGRSLDRAAVTRLGRRRSRHGSFRPSAMPGGSAAATVRASAFRSSAATVRASA
ncbi:MAG: rod shape-determining protein MreD, partial [Streptosporangiaceae bacterium]